MSRATRSFECVTHVRSLHNVRYEMFSGTKSSGEALGNQYVIAIQFTDV